MHVPCPFTARTYTAGVWCNLGNFRRIGPNFFQNFYHVTMTIETSTNTCVQPDTKSKANPNL